jgi:hypothetical protein
MRMAREIVSLAEKIDLPEVERPESSSLILKAIPSSCPMFYTRVGEGRLRP